MIIYDYILLYMIIYDNIILYELGMGYRLGDDVILYQFTSRDGCRGCDGPQALVIWRTNSIGHHWLHESVARGPNQKSIRILWVFR